MKTLCERTLHWRSLPTRNSSRSCPKSQYLRTVHCCDQVKEYIEGGEFQERQEGAARIQRDVKLLEGSRKDHAISTASTIKERFAKMDLEEAEAARQEADEYLGLALKSYLAVLCQGSRNRSQAAVYRLVALWFANAESNPVLLSIPSTLPKVSFLSQTRVLMSVILS